MASSRPALLSLERDVAGETMETELSRVGATSCVIGAVFCQHKGSNGLIPSRLSPSAARGGFGLFRAGHRFTGLCVVFNIKPGDRFAPESSL